jgi:hypothetical protein
MVNKCTNIRVRGQSNQNTRKAACLGSMWGMNTRRC